MAARGLLTVAMAACLRSCFPAVGWITGLTGGALGRPPAQLRSSVGRSDGEVGRERPLPFNDLEVGMELEGRVARKSEKGVWVDIGYERYAMITASRQLAFRLKANETVATTVEKVDQKRREIWVSVAGLEKLKPWEELKVGLTKTGRVSYRSRAGVFVDIGFEKTGLVVAANYSQPFETLGRDQIVTATVEEVDSRKNTFKVSVAGVPKPRSFKELRVGETLKGQVGTRSERGVFVDVGCDKAALVIAPREEAYSLERRQPVTATVERVLGEIFWVSVAGLSKLKFPEELQVGKIVNGTVVKKSTTSGVLIDIGNAEMARVLAPREQAYAKLDYNQNVTAKIEKTTKDGILVSLDPLGLKRLKLLEQLKEGDTVDGEYVMSRGKAVMFDIGCESLAALEGPRDQVLKLKKFDKLKGMRIDKVDVEARKITLSFAGLSDHVAGRKLPRRQGSAQVLRAPR